MSEESSRDPAEEIASKAHNEAMLGDKINKLGWEAAVVSAKNSGDASQDDRDGSGEFDPARASIKDTLEEVYASEIARLMGVPDGQTPEQTLDPVSLKIYQQHLNDKESNIAAVIERLALKSKNANTPLDNVSNADTTRELAEALFG